MNKRLKCRPSYSHSQGQYTINVHAGKEQELIKEALLMFKYREKCRDHHNSLNYKNWLKGKLIPNLPSNSVFVIDNVSYQNTQLNPSRNSNFKKSDIIT